jgi:hypothetical protein
MLHHNDDAVPRTVTRRNTRLLDAGSRSVVARAAVFQFGGYRPAQRYEDAQGARERPEESLASQNRAVFARNLAQKYVHGIMSGRVICEV